LKSFYKIIRRVILNMNRSEITLYHDPYETTMGDGFYPSINSSHGCNCPIKILFNYKNGYWYQDADSKYGITSLTNISYLSILEYLNTKCDQSAKGIKNKYNRGIKTWDYNEAESFDDSGW